MAEMIGDLIFTPGEDEPADSMSLIGMRAVVTPAGFEPAISTLKGSRPGPG